jgi:pimeloyl-ACP methyl ester carboxylesterase
MLVITHNNILLRCSNAPIAKGDVWVIHGFSKSGLTFKNAIDSALSSYHNIWIPDLPGFGAKPFQNHLAAVHDYIELLVNLITEKSMTPKIFMVVHSFGSVIATLIFEKLNEKIAGFISVEGNLTQAGSYFSGWAGQCDDDGQFQKEFKKLLNNKAKDRPEFECYFASATIADPKALTIFGKSSCDYAENEDAGNRFLSLQRPTLYLWGDVDTPLSTQNFIKNNFINNYLFKGTLIG